MTKSKKHLFCEFFCCKNQVFLNKYQCPENGLFFLWSMFAHNFYSYFYRPQRTCEGYVFTGVCLSTGEGGAWSRGVWSWGWGLLLGGGAPGPRGGVCSWGMPGPRRVGIPACTEADPPPGRDGHCSGRYASYWNAFLFAVYIVLLQWKALNNQDYSDLLSHMHYIKN